MSFITPEAEAHFQLIEKRQNQRLARETVAGFEPTAVAVSKQPPGTGGIKGKRPSKKDKLRCGSPTASAQADPKTDATSASATGSRPQRGSAWAWHMRDSLQKCASRPWRVPNAPTHSGKPTTCLTH